MSALTPLSPWNLWRSHLVNCNKCIAMRLQHKMCPVGLVLWAKAKEAGDEEASKRPMSFPFVAKMFERIKAHIKGEWVEASVRDLRIAAAGRMIGDYRAKTQAVTGYEVETDDGERHFVNSKQIQSMRPKKAFTPRETKLPVVGPTAAPFDDGILVILRRS